MAHQQTLNFNLYPQGKFAERCVGFVDDLARWEEANQPRTCALKKQDRLAREASCKVLLANLHQTWKRDPASTLGVLKKTNWYSDHRNTISPLISQTVMRLVLRFFADRNLIEVVSEGRKHPAAKYGIPTQIRARQGLIDYLDQDDASPADFRSEYPQLVLKAGKEDSKRHLTIPDTDEAQQLALGADQINEMLGFHWADGVIVPWLNDTQPFMVFSGKVRENRKALEKAACLRGLGKRLATAFTRRLRRA